MPFSQTQMMASGACVFGAALWASLQYKASGQVVDSLRFFDDPLYLLCAVYLVGVPLLELFCKTWDIYTPYRQYWKRIIVGYNFALAAYSLLSSVLMMCGMAQNGVFHMGEHGSVIYSLTGRVFYWSKYVEFLDTVFLVLAGKPVTWLQYVHHAGAPLDMGIHSNYRVPSMWIFVSLNGVIHTVMYTYYAFSILKWRFPLKQAITSLQLIQFFSGLAIVSRYPYVAGFWDCEACRVAWTFNVSYVTVLIVLFANFYVQTYMKKGGNGQAAASRSSFSKLSDASPTSTACPSLASPSGSDADGSSVEMELKEHQMTALSAPPRDKSRKKEDCVKVLYKGSEIDVTNWQNRHPGGPKVLKIFNGRDATSAIVAMHSGEALERIEKMAKDQTLLEPIVYDYIELMKQAKTDGLFAPCWGNEAFKASYSLGSFIAGVALLGAYPYTSACLLAFGWFQIGWLGHDWSHHTALATSTTKWAGYCDIGAVICGAVRGTTILWWKLRHNTHHVVTNQNGQDPDIRTSPLLRFFDDFDPNNVTKWQAVYYVPVLFLLHLYWYVESWQVTLRYLGSISKPMKTAARRDFVGMSLHTVGMIWLTVGTGHYMPVLLAYALSGFGTAIVVFASHYAEERIDEHVTLGFFEQTMRTTRNIGGFLPFGLDDGFWFHLTGGLSHQIEHHLFPMMPRANLRQMTTRVKALAAKHGLSYMESHLGKCTLLAVQCLAANVTRNLRAEEKQ